MEDASVGRKIISIIVKADLPVWDNRLYVSNFCIKNHISKKENYQTRKILACLGSIY